MTQRCTKCQVAPVTEQDRYCFYCGEQLLGLKLDLRKERVVMAAHTEPTTLIDASIENTGQLPQRVRLAESEAPWMTFRNADDSGPPPTAWTLAPKAKAAFRVCITVDPSLSDVLEATVRVDGDGNSDDLAKSIKVLPPIRAIVKWHDVDTLYMFESTLPDLRGEVLIESAEPVTVAAFETDTHWARAERDASDGSLRVVIDHAGLRGALDRSHPESVELPIRVTLAELPLVDAVSQIRLEWPAQLEAFPVRHLGSDGHGDDDALVWSARRGRLHLLDVDLVNGGGRQAVVKDVHVTDPENRSYLLERSLLNLPVVIAPGERVRLRIAVDLTGECPGDIVSTLVADTDDLEEPAQSSTLRIEALSPPRTNWAAGLDFGTTNSCFAVWRSSEPEVRFLAPGLRSLGEQPNKLEVAVRSNAVYHHRISDSLRTCEIGVTDKAAEPIEGVKRDLGQRVSVQVRFKADHQCETLTAEQIAGDIIRELLAGAEDVLGCKPQSCAVTHPVNFNHEERELLRDAIERMGVEVDVLVPEPVAAALEFAVAHGEKFDNGDGIERDLGPLYSILVIDIGGGTTDIAVVDMRDDRQPRGGNLPDRIITPTLLSVRGLRWAGGEDITWAMVERKLLEGIAEGDRGGMLDVTAEVRRKILMRDRQTRREYRTQLFEPAEAEKIDPNPLVTFFLRNKEELGDIAEAFVAHHGIVDLCRLALRDAGLDAPDVLLLVGQSWAIPRLREIVAKEFGEVPAFPPANASAEDLKRLVALGACRFAHFGRASQGYHLDWDSGQLKTLKSTRWGILRGDPTGKTYFHTLEDEGENPTAESLRVRLPKTSKGKRIELARNSGILDDLRVPVNGFLVENPEIERIGTITVPRPPHEDREAGSNDDLWLVVQTEGENATDVHVEVNGQRSSALWEPEKPSRRMDE